ncbi:methylated-DNA--protein-cysteine methyltransferase [Sulfolobus acidocaldarius SUSAZ]|nr:methylated-DNA--protein-cysteine methyltransferase [Sulfolobus acidocaldarius SUSAZ]
MIVYGVYNSPLGIITVARNERGIIMLDFCDCAERNLVDNSTFTDLFDKFDNYFEGKPVEFNETVDLFVNNFRRRVFNEVRRIGWGKVKTYKEVAETLKTSPRAVGMALSKNPVLLIIPCHRIIAESGLGGFSRGTELKKKLLELEGVNIEALVRG